MLPYRRLSLYAHTIICVKNFTATTMNSWQLSAVLTGHQYEHPSSADWRQGVSGHLQPAAAAAERCLGCNCGLPACPQRRPRCRRHVVAANDNTSCKNKQLARPAYVHSRPVFGATSRSEGRRNREEGHSAADRHPSIHPSFMNYIEVTCRFHCIDAMSSIFGRTCGRPHSLSRSTRFAAGRTTSIAGMKWLQRNPRFSHSSRRYE